MPNILEIARLNTDLILRQHAFEVTDISDVGVQELIDDMLYMCQEMNILGLSAPHIFRRLRIIIVSSEPTTDYPGAMRMDPLVLINPVIIKASEEMITGNERSVICDEMGKIDRHKWIQVTFTDRHGRPQERIFTDLAARVFQHEFDQIEGVTFSVKIID